MKVLVEVFWRDVTKKYLRADSSLRGCCPVAVVLNSILHSDYKALVDSCSAYIVSGTYAYVYEHSIKLSDELGEWVGSIDVQLAREDEDGLRSLFPKSFVLEIPEKYIFG